MMMGGGDMSTSSAIRWPSYRPPSRRQKGDLQDDAVLHSSIVGPNGSHPTTPFFLLCKEGPGCIGLEERFS